MSSSMIVPLIIIGNDKCLERRSKVERNETLNTLRSWRSSATVGGVAESHLWKTLRKRFPERDNLPGDCTTPQGKK